MKSLGYRVGIVGFEGDIGHGLKLKNSPLQYSGGGDVFLTTTIHVEGARFPFVLVQTEMTAGYRALEADLSTYSFKTSAFPLSFSIIGELYPTPLFRPFLSLGGGLIFYGSRAGRSTEDVRPLGTITGSEANLCLWFPLRVGLRCTPDRRFDIVVTLERSVTLSDRLDGIVSRTLDWKNDNFEMLSLGVSMHIGESIASVIATRSKVIDMDPLPPSKRQPPDTTLVLGQVKFIGETADLAPEACAFLDSLADAWREVDGFLCTITSISNVQDNEESEKTLGWQRATVVKHYLAAKGVRETQLRIEPADPANRDSDNPDRGSFADDGVILLFEERDTQEDLESSVESSR
ncbi:MAG: hypothetical protein QHI48_00650 [Bacteroidota bacterium]|nr:hypothetical protein [Bacteroidota bacterium]